MWVASQERRVDEKLFVLSQCGYCAGTMIRDFYVCFNGLTQNQSLEWSVRQLKIETEMRIESNASTTIADRATEFQVHKSKLGANLETENWLIDQS